MSSLTLEHSYSYPVLSVPTCIYPLWMVVLGRQHVALIRAHVRVYLCRDVAAGDLETAECRLDDAYANCEKEKNLRYVHVQCTYT